MHRQCCVIACSLAAGLIISHSAWAQGMARNALPPAAAVTAAPVLQQNLAAALAAARPPSGVALAVDADKVAPLPGMVWPGVQPSIIEVADAFGRLARPFGGVTAIAPPTMTVLNTDLKQPQIYDGMPASDALKLLCATLTPMQWQTLTGERGLGEGDLTTDDQRALFHTCFPAHTLKVWPANAGGPGGPLDVSSELPQARLRLGSHSDIELPVSDHEWHGGSEEDTNGGKPRYNIYHSDERQATLYGNVVKAELPNEAKRGDLAFGVTALHVPVPLTGLKTVGDLVYRIGSLVKVELYADPHYAKRLLTVVTGPDATPTAGDLLRALALCLTATYRQVGPAYVLTDDLLGVGTRRQMVADFADLADQMRRKPLDAAGDVVAAQHGMADLRGFGGADQAPTPEQMRKGQSDEFSADTPGAYLRLTFADLTPTQQAAARAIADKAAAEPVQGGMLHPPSLTGTLLVVTRPMLELLIPSLPGPVDLGAYSLNDLFRPSPETAGKRREAVQAAREKAAPKPSGPQTAPPAKPAPPTLSQVLAHIPRRAALVDARTPAEIDAAVAALKALGLNQLWLPVFADGKARIPGTPFSAPGDKTDVLAEARRATAGTGIAVFATLDLLTWGADAPDAAQDLTVRGDNSAQAVQHRQQRAAQAAGSDTPATAHQAKARLTVSPFAPTVRESLTALVQAVGTAPGVAGVVWRETAPPGYGDSRFNQEDAFGYSREGRLAFLRSAHSDPIDVDVSGSSADTSLPFWDDAGENQAAWKKFRADAANDLLRTLLAAWPAGAAGGGRRAVFIQQRSDSWQGDWFGSWDGPHAPLPAFRQGWEQPGNGPPPPDDPALQAKAQSRLALLRVDRWAAFSPAGLAENLNERRKKPWDGFVLVYDGTDNSGLADLQALAAQMAPKPPPRPGKQTPP